MSNWSSADTFYTAALLLFGVIGLWRGFFRSLFSVLAIGVGFIIAAIFYHITAIGFASLPGSFQTHCVEAFLILLLAGYIAEKLTERAFKHKTEVELLGQINRILGFGFGVLRGIIFVMIIATVGLLATSPDTFRAWTSKGEIAPSITIAPEALTDKVQPPTDELYNVFMKQMLAWGVNESEIDKIYIDPDMMKELVKLGKQWQPPNITIPPQLEMYDKVQELLNDTTGTMQQKARKMWELILTAQNFNIPGSIPAASDHIFRDKDK